MHGAAARVHGVAAAASARVHLGLLLDLLLCEDLGPRLGLRRRLLDLLGGGAGGLRLAPRLLRRARARELLRLHLRSRLRPRPRPGWVGESAPGRAARAACSSNSPASNTLGEEHPLDDDEGLLLGEGGLLGVGGGGGFSALVGGGSPTLGEDHVASASEGDCRGARPRQHGGRPRWAIARGGTGRGGTGRGRQSAAPMRRRGMRDGRAVLIEQAGTAERWRGSSCLGHRRRRCRCRRRRRHHRHRRLRFRHRLGPRLRRRRRGCLRLRLGLVTI